MPPDEPNEEEALEQLDEDHETPFSPAEDTRTDATDQNLEREIEDSETDDTDPDYDTDVEQEELYDQGRAKEKPNAGNAVTDYHPDEDQRHNKDANPAE